MDPLEIGPEHWDQISRSITSVVASVGLGLSGALAFLVWRALLPTETASGPTTEGRWLRRATVFTTLVALIGAATALGVGIVLAVEVLGSIYPRFLI